MPWVRVRGRGRESGFTLIEVMIVIVIVGILMALLLPNLVRSRLQGQLSACEHGERAIASAMENYAAQYRRYPADLDKLFDNNYVQRMQCPSNLASYGLLVDTEGRTYTLFCNGIHHVVLPEVVDAGYPQYSPSSGLSRR